LRKIWNIIKKTTTSKDIEKNKELKKSNSEQIIIEDFWETRLYRSPFWIQLTALLEKFIHKKLTIDYIQ
jgi:hypothetical protein